MATAKKRGFVTNGLLVQETFDGFPGVCEVVPAGKPARGRSAAFATARLACSPSGVTTAVVVAVVEFAYCVVREIALVAGGPAV